MIGNQIAAGQALTIANDSFNGDGSTVAFTLSQTVSSVNDIEVLVDNVQQSPYDSSYSVNGTTLTFSGAPSTGTNNVYVIYNASKHITTSQVIPDNGTITAAKLHSGLSVPDSNIAGMASSKLTGDISHANMPAGSIIQCLVGTGAAAQSAGGCNAVGIGGTTTSTSHTVDMYMQITPKFATSKIVIFCNSGCSISGGYATFEIRETVAAARISHAGWGNFGGAQQVDGVFLSAVHVPGNTVQRTYQLRAQQTGGTRYIHYNATPNMTIMEIAQ